jgi:hypothetical protein
MGRKELPCNSAWTTDQPRRGRSTSLRGNKPARCLGLQASGVGARICRRWPAATPLGGSSTEVGCGSAEPQAGVLSPLLLLPLS